MKKEEKKEPMSTHHGVALCLDTLMRIAEEGGPRASVTVGAVVTRLLVRLEDQAFSQGCSRRDWQLEVDRLAVECAKAEELDRQVAQA